MVNENVHSLRPSSMSRSSDSMIILYFSNSSGVISFPSRLLKQCCYSDDVFKLNFECLKPKDSIKKGRRTTCFIEIAENLSCVTVK